MCSSRIDTDTYDPCDTRIFAVQSGWMFWNSRVRRVRGGLNALCCMSSGSGGGKESEDRSTRRADAVPEARYGWTDETPAGL